MDKMILEGDVAVLISSGHGAGWSTWNSTHPELLFDPEIVKLVLDEKYDEIEAYCDRTYGKDTIYCGGARDLEVNWVPVGARFRVNEYDGFETLVLDTEDNWFVA